MIATASILASVMAFAPGPSSSEAAPSAASDARPSPYVQVGLGGGAILRRSFGNLRTTGGPTFAAEAGAAWNPRPRLRLGVGGMLAHTGYDGIKSANTDLAALLRLGMGTSGLWGHGIVGLGATQVVDDDAIFDDQVLTDRHFGPSMIVGVGMRGHVGGGVSLGFELSSVLTLLPPHREAVRISGLLVVAVQFGGRGPSAG